MPVIEALGIGGTAFMLARNYEARDDGVAYHNKQAVFTISESKKTV